MPAYLLAVIRFDKEPGIGTKSRVMPEKQCFECAFVSLLNLEEQSFIAYCARGVVIHVDLRFGQK